MDWQLTGRIAISVVVAYLLGGIPWALIVGKGFYGIDVRQVGSGNLGATNVLRALGPFAGGLTLLLDIAKGATAVGVAWALVPTSMYGVSAHQWAMIAATMAAILGHSYSPYIGFKGGKGVATAAGALLVLTPYAWPYLLGTVVVVVLIWRMVSLGSVAAAFEYPFLCLWLYRGDWPIILFAFAASALVIWRHHANIRRILRGEEPKISLRRSGTAAKREGGS